VVSASWLQSSFRPAATIDEYTRFGLHRYLDEVSIVATPRPRRDLWVGAVGNGGHRLYVAPTLQLVVAITAGNYDQPGQGRMRTTLWRDVVLPSLRRPGVGGVG
jgi:hypothetical protein